jgi:serine/threonine protein kinase
LRSGRALFQQLLIALDFCSAIGVAKRNLTPEHILLMDDGAGCRPPRLKLGSFGLSKDENSDSMCKTACGSPGYVAPEARARGARPGSPGALLSKLVDVLQVYMWSGRNACGSPGHAGARGVLPRLRASPVHLAMAERARRFRMRSAGACTKCTPVPCANR